jgi:hypothetical protein
VIGDAPGASGGQTWWGEAPGRSMNFTKRPGESGRKVLLGQNVRRAVAQRWVRLGARTGLTT